MQLLINAIPLLAEESGIGNYTRQICNAVLASREFNSTFFYGYYSKKLRKIVPQNNIWLGNLGGIARKGSLARKICKKALRLANMAANIINKATWDCYFEPNFLLLPSLHAKSTVITIHDFSCFRYPQWHPAERVRHMEKYFWESVNRADHIITVSEPVRQEACATYGISPDRITAIPNGVDHALFSPQPQAALEALRRQYDLPENFVLYVGTLEPRKNIANLARAHSRLPAGLRSRFPLLLAGSNGWNNSEIMGLIRAHPRHIRALGYVPRHHLPLFYSAATIFAYPSWYEGFGLPAVEAMACGRAVLTSTDPALSALCGNAALATDPADVESLTDNMRRLLEDTNLRQSLEQNALKNAAAYSWEASGAKHMQVFEKTARAC